jgi:hypothetical protein
MGSALSRHLLNSVIDSENCEEIVLKGFGIFIILKNHS